MAAVPRRDRLTAAEWEAIFITAPIGFEGMYQDELSGEHDDSWARSKREDHRRIERARAKLRRARDEGRI